MNESTPTDQQALREQLAQSRGRLEELADDLRSIDAELEGLAKERHQYGLLHEACDALEELGALGAGALFWGERDDLEAHAHLRGVRSRVEIFEGQIREIEGRRAAVEDRVRGEREKFEWIEEDLVDVLEEEERRKQEWLIERDVEPPWRDARMPWAHGGEDDRRLRRSLAAALLASLLLGLVFPWIDLPLPEPTEVVEVPERLARLIRQERPLPPPPQREEKPPEPKDLEVPEEKPLVAEETRPSETPQPAPAEPAAAKGILAFREKFSSLAATSPADRLGSQARISTSDDGASGTPQRSMVTTQAPGSSGGINLASLSRDLGGGGGQIEGVAVARATSSIGGGGGQDRPLAGGPGAGRTDEEIQIVFDRHKAALYRLYNRELRRDPTLKGQMVLRLRIEPDGSVSLCEVQGTDMNAPDLSAQVVARVRTFDFGAKEVPAVTILYPIDFLPAT